MNFDKMYTLLQLPAQSRSTFPGLQDILWCLFASESSPEVTDALLWFLSPKTSFPCPRTPYALDHAMIIHFGNCLVLLSLLFWDSFMALCVLVVYIFIAE